MDLVLALVATLALAAIALTAGLVVRARSGRARAVSGERVDAEALGIHPLTGPAFGDGATLVQFSTEFCARCPGVHRALDALAAEREGVRVIEVDLTHRADLARRHGVLQTPTVLVVDAAGAVTSRLSGAVRPTDVAAALDALPGLSPALTASKEPR